MTLSTDRGHLVLALLQGIAAQIGELVSAIQADADHARSTDCAPTAA